MNSCVHVWLVMCEQWGHICWPMVMWPSRQVVMKLVWRHWNSHWQGRLCCSFLGLVYPHFLVSNALIPLVKAWAGMECGNDICLFLAMVPLMLQTIWICGYFCCNRLFSLSFYGATSPHVGSNSPPFCCWLNYISAQPWDDQHNLEVEEG